MPDAILERMKNVNLEEAWSVLRGKGFEWQYEGRFQLVHLDETATMVGRALTATFVPKRPDLDKALTEKGHADGHVGGRNSWPIDMLQKGDVYVANAFGSYEGGPIIGGNLAHRDLPQLRQRRRVRRLGARHRPDGDDHGLQGLGARLAPLVQLRQHARRDQPPGPRRHDDLPARATSSSPSARASCASRRRSPSSCARPASSSSCATCSASSGSRRGSTPRARSTSAGADDMEKDFSKWLNDHIDKLPVPREQIQELLKERTW